MSGRVTLIGAGPGDAGLLTLKGRDALQKAEVVIYDRLVGENILAMIPADAEKIDAGKASANHKLPQEEINALLLKKAQEGKNVVRLKGGDCFLFGRGGEELALLYEHNIDFCVIPGVTSALAAPAYAGIPVTHRDFSSSVHIITAHARAGKKLDIDFESLVKMGGTLIFLMGVANMELIVDGLIKNGMAPSTPCAVVQQGTTWGQKKFIGTLHTITETAKAAKSPSVIVVGAVCTLSDKYDWFSKLPLFGKTVAVTRPAERSGTLSDQLRMLGARVIECPCIRTESLMQGSYAEEVLELFALHDIAVFTSPAGVRAVMRGILDAGKDARVFAAMKIAAIGSATAAELRKYSLKADFVPETYDGAHLGELLAEKAERSDKLLLLRAERSDPALNSVLDSAGYSYTELAVYRTVEGCDKDISAAVNAGEIDYVTFTSASTVRGFMRMDVDTARFTGVCIGKTTKEEADRLGINTIIAEQAKIDSLCEAILKDVNNGN